AEDGIRDDLVTGVQTCALPIFAEVMVQCATRAQNRWGENATLDIKREMERIALRVVGETLFGVNLESHAEAVSRAMTRAIGSPSNMMVQIGRASCRERE